MRRWFLGAALGLALAVSAAADDPPKKDDAPKTPAERLAAIKKETAAAQAEFYKVVRDLDDKKKEDVEKAEKLYKEFGKKQEAGFAAALEIAKADPKSDVGFDALNWMLGNQRTYYLPAGKTALELAAVHQAANPKLAPTMRMLGYFVPHESADSHAAAVALLKAVTEKNPNRVARAYAAMGLAGLAVRRSAAADFKKAADADKLAAAAETELEAVLKEYGDSGGTVDVGDWAKGQLFELRNLRVGKVAPDIAGEDLDEVKFKLSDYRGKVVVIDFWGDW
ncbi:MAG TPA: hypothetical protein VFG68_23320 [Fimbriiglobus sp.]|nr:hypothetical protein [Fimbriiglobus sp.]